MNAVLAFVEVLDVEFDDVADGVVEHEEAGGLLDGSGWSGDVDQVEDGRQDLVHPLHVLDAGVQLGVDVQDPGHVVVPVRLPLLSLVQQELPIRQIFLSVDQLEFLASGRGQVRQHDLRGWSGKEGELCVGAGGIFLDLLPEKVVLFKFLETRVILLHEEGVVGELILGQEHLDQTAVGLGLLGYSGSPFSGVLWQIVQDHFPAVLSNYGSLVGNALTEVVLELCKVDYWLVEDID